MALELTESAKTLLLEHGVSDADAEAGGLVGTGKGGRVLKGDAVTFLESYSPPEPEPEPEDEPEEDAAGTADEPAAGDNGPEDDPEDAAIEESEADEPEDEEPEAEDNEGIKVTGTLAPVIDFLRLRGGDRVFQDGDDDDDGLPDNVAKRVLDAVESRRLNVPEGGAVVYSDSGNTAGLAKLLSTCPDSWGWMLVVDTNHLVLTPTFLDPETGDEVVRRRLK